MSNSDYKKEKKDRVLTFTRKEIEDSIIDKLLGRKLTKKLIVDSFIEALREMIMKADPVIRIEIRDFGVFEVKKTKPKPKARNLKTGEFVFVPGRRKMHFKPGKLLKEFLKSDVNKS